MEVGYGGGQLTTWLIDHGALSVELDCRTGRECEKACGNASRNQGRPFSEHQGDAGPDTLVYFRVHEVDAVTAEFAAGVDTTTWIAHFPKDLSKVRSVSGLRGTARGRGV